MDGCRPRRLAAAHAGTPQRRGGGGLRVLLRHDKQEGRLQPSRPEAGRLREEGGGDGGYNGSGMGVGLVVDGGRSVVGVGGPEV